MNETARKKLCEIIAREGGQAICEQPERLEALLRDLAAGQTLEINLLMVALREGVAAGLLAEKNKIFSGALPGKFSSLLQKNRGLDEKNARWAVESWAVALGISINQRTPAPINYKPPRIPPIKGPASGKPIPKKTARLILMSIAAALALFLVITLTLYGSGFLQTQDNSAGNMIRVKEKTSFKIFCDQLQDQRIIKSARLFYYGARIFSKAPKVKKGEIKVEPRLRIDELPGYLQNTNPLTKTVVIPDEVSTATIITILREQSFAIDQREFVRLLDDAAFINELGLRRFKAKSLFGLLYADTYNIGSGCDTKDIVRAMTEKFIAMWQQHDCDRLYERLRQNYLLANPRLADLSRYDMIILASIVDALVDPAHADKMPATAQVYYNRLTKSMPLNLTRENAGAEAAARTRKPGLLKQPLNNPSLEAILATLRPEKHGFLYLKDIGIE